MLIICPTVCAVHVPYIKGVPITLHLYKTFVWDAALIQANTVCLNCTSLWYLIMMHMFKKKDHSVIHVLVTLSRIWIFAKWDFWWYIGAWLYLAKCPYVANFCNYWKVAPILQAFVSLGPFAISSKQPLSHKMFTKFCEIWAVCKIGASQPLHNYLSEPDWPDQYWGIRSLR